jgi:hypothetical protein
LVPGSQQGPPMRDGSRRAHVYAMGANEVKQWHDLIGHGIFCFAFLQLVNRMIAQIERIAKKQSGKQ